MDNLDLLMRLGVSLAIGLIFGIERGWSQRVLEAQERASGIRSFALSGLIGGVTALLGQVAGWSMAGLVFLGFAGVFAAFQWRESLASGALSVTSTLAGLLTFLLGALAASGDMQVAVAAAIVAVGLLSLREALHAWVSRLTATEIRDGLILLAMAFLLLPLLPARAVDPWGLVNLREIWIMATLIAGLSFLGYAAVRALGPRWGILITAAAGGLASSTATTLSLARLARGAAPARLLVAGMLVAGTVMLARVMAIVAVLQPGLLVPLAAPMGATALAFLAAAVWLSRTEMAPGLPDLGIRSPLDLWGALRMAGLIGVVMLVSGLVQRQYGAAGLDVVAAISGLADVDAITLSAARMTGAAQDLADAILIAVAVNSLSKAVLASWIGRQVVGWRFLGLTLLGLGCGCLAYLLS